MASDLGVGLDFKEPIDIVIMAPKEFILLNDRTILEHYGTTS